MIVVFDVAKLIIVFTNKAAIEYFVIKRRVTVAGVSSHYSINSATRSSHAAQ